MSGSSPVERFTDSHEQPYALSFLKTHRALAACTREFVRLSEEIDTRVTTLLQAGLEAKAEIRHSPGRCIVQLGNVALTVAWVRTKVDSVEDGRLLVIVWRGAVAPRRKHVFERREAETSSTATALWENVLTVSASTEEDWTWCPETSGARGYSSTELATLLVQRLHRAYAEHPRES